MKKYDNIIAVDPDTDKSGVAFLEVATRKLEVSSLTFPDLLNYLQFAKKVRDERNQSVIVVVEAGWLNVKSNWHTANDRAGQRIAKNTGANHQVGKLIIEMCRYYGLEVVEQRPLKKCWKGRDGKITHDELAAFTGLMGRTGQEGRDAVLIAWVYAGLPVKNGK
jgi:hypothetical protein